MADVKWIKFYVSILTNKKIKRIRKMPDGDTIALIWAFLLAQAGESNKEGGIYFNDEIPYSPEDFASDYDFKPTTVQLAVSIFEKYGMIGVFDGIIYVKNWNKYQSIDSMEKMKEQNRIRQSSFKERKKLTQNNVTYNVTDNAEVTHGNATDIELDIELDIEEEREREKPIESNKDIPADKSSLPIKKHKYGEYQNVLLTDIELEKLKSLYGAIKADECIAFLDEHIERLGYKAKSHYLCIRKWVLDAVNKPNQKPDFKQVIKEWGND